MSNFELFMSFFGLLLGLAVAELMSGFANLARAKDRSKIGLITPVLGLVMFLSIMTSLLDAFRKLQDVPISLIGFALPTLIGIAYSQPSLPFPATRAAGNRWTTTFSSDAPGRSGCCWQPPC